MSALTTARTWVRAASAACLRPAELRIDVDHCDHGIERELALGAGWDLGRWCGAAGMALPDPARAQRLTACSQTAAMRSTSW